MNQRKKYTNATIAQNIKDMADDTWGSDPLYIACRENRENRPPI